MVERKIIRNPSHYPSLIGSSTSIKQISHKDMKTIFDTRNVGTIKIKKPKFSL